MDKYTIPVVVGAEDKLDEAITRLRGQMLRGDQYPIYDPDGLATRTYMRVVHLSVEYATEGFHSYTVGYQMFHTSRYDEEQPSDEFLDIKGGDL